MNQSQLTSQHNQQSEKSLWESLAKTNPRYYIFTDFSKGITEDQFHQSGQKDYERFILEDKFLKSRGTLLEIGCGIGRMTEFMAKDFEKVIGTDIAKTMIDLGKKRLQKFPNARLYETDGISLPVKDQSVDLIFSYIVFQHFKSKKIIKKNFQEVARVLKPGGIFKVLLKITGPEHLDRWWGGVCLSQKEIKTLCQQSGLKIAQLKPSSAGRTWFWLTKARLPKSKSLSSNKTIFSRSKS